MLNLFNRTQTNTDGRPEIAAQSFAEQYVIRTISEVERRVAARLGAEESAKERLDAVWQCVTAEIKGIEHSLGRFGVGSIMAFHQDPSGISHQIILKGESPRHPILTIVAYGIKAIRLYRYAGRSAEVDISKGTVADAAAAVIAQAIDLLAEEYLDGRKALYTEAE